MEPDRPRYLRPALQAGLLSGLVSVFPILSWANAICCLWILAGSALSVRFFMKRSAVPPKPADGAILGAMTGIIAAIVQMIVFVPVLRNPAFFQQVIESASRWGLGSEPVIPVGSTGFLLIITLFMTVTNALFGALGGIIGVALFAKKTAPPQAPAPPPAAPAAPPQGPPDAA